MKLFTRIVLVFAIIPSAFARDAEVAKDPQEAVKEVFSYDDVAPSGTETYRVLNRAVAQRLKKSPIA